MSRTQTADLGAQIAEQRDRLSESVGAVAEKLGDKIDTTALTDKVEKITSNIDTDEIRAKAEAGASQLLDQATDDQGRPKKGFLLGALGVVVVLAIVRRLVR
ncbi:F0F1-type ATP synthase membrane subunit b/b' [Marmoricola sp. OAE513]|uniref:hypothetical protein n=1 Tax=Marmoricola sp. OAE513 TaxID=2817894 RepID=UPI001AE6A529